MKNFLLFVCFVFFGNEVWGQTTVLATWDFPSGSTGVIDGGITANNLKQIATIGGTGIVGYGNIGATTNSATASNWDSGNDLKYWQIDVVTTGYNNLTISSKQRASNTGPRDFKVQYRIGLSGLWTDISASSITLADDFTSGVLTNISLPSACDNNTQIFLRWIMISNTSVSGSAVSSVGTSRIDDIFVKGTPTSPSTDHFKSKQTGNWNMTTSWESSTDNITWINASFVPNNNANSIIIQPTHTITMSDSHTFDQLVVNGTLTLNSGINTITINDGIGNDVVVNNGGLINIAGTNVDNIAFTGNIQINNGGILRYASGGGTTIAEKLAGTTANTQIVYMNNGIFEWGSGGGYSSSGITYFATSNGLDIPIFRVIQSCLMGATAKTTFNGIYEINTGITTTIQNSGNKFFRNGIRGTGTITQNANSGKLVINGTTAELSGITLNLNSNGLELNNNGTININNNLTLTTGLLNFVSSDLNLNGKTFFVNGGTIQEDLANNFTIIDNTATTELSQGGNIQYSASVTNTANNFLGLGLSLNHNGSGDYTINVKRRHYAAGYGNAITRIYDITGTPTGVSTIGINYASSELGLVTIPLKVSRWQSGLGWANYDPTTVDYANRFVTYNNVTGFSSWTLSSATISLPVSLVSFEAKQITDNQANINWTTATEINNKQFQIWKSIDGFEYHLIGTKDGQGNANQVKNYNLIDNQFNQNSYYQLKQIDNNGQINNIGLKFLAKKLENNIEIYPNPITEKIYIRNQTADLFMVIFDNIGRKIIETTHQNELQTQLDLLPKGIYTAQFRNKNGLKTQILVKN